jgi:hypothetical protein
MEDELRLAAREVEEHLCKVAVHPGEPRPCVGRRVVDVDRLVDQSQPVRVLYVQQPTYAAGDASSVGIRDDSTAGTYVRNQVQRIQDVVVVVGAEDSGYLRHRPRVPDVHMRAAISANQ